MTKKSTLRTKTFRRYVVVKGCRQDFGLGPGVIARDDVTYRDPRGHGFDLDGLFGFAVRADAVEMVLASVTVLVDDWPSWDEDPQASQAKEKAGRKARKRKSKRQST